MKKLVAASFLVLLVLIIGLFVTRAREAPALIPTDQAANTVRTIPNQANDSYRAPAVESDIVVSMPSVVKTGSTYKVSWKDVMGTSFAQLLEKYPQANVMLIAYNTDDSLGIAQTVVDAPASTLRSGSVTWTIGDRSNDGRELPAGQYFIKFAMSVRDPRFPQQSSVVGQGNGSIFSISK